MARTNPNVNATALDSTAKDNQPKQTARLLLLEAGAQVPEKEKKNQQPNSLALINVLLALKPNKLLKWLGLEPNNPIKLSEFVAAVQDKYDKLAADYNKLQAKRDKLLSSQNQNKAKDKELAQQ